MNTNFITPQDKFPTEKSINENSKQYEKYYLIKNNCAYKFKIIKLKQEILIICKDYSIKLTNDDLFYLTKSKFNSINESFNFIISIFESNKVTLKDILINERIKLNLQKNISKKEKEFEIDLSYRGATKTPLNNENESSIYLKQNNNYIQLQTDINNLKEEIQKIKIEFYTLKSTINSNLNLSNKEQKSNKDNEFYTNDGYDRKELLIDLVNDSYSGKDWLDNSFAVFKSLDDIISLVYSTKEKSLIAYDLVTNKKIKEIKKAHNDYITNIKHFLDEINQRGLIISISFDENNLKLWNFSTEECICSINNINKSKSLISSCIINYKNIYIITNGTNNKDDIKIYNIKGKFIAQFTNSNEPTNSIISYYDKKLDKHYIITGNDKYVKSYEFQERKIYYKYSDNCDSEHSSLIVCNIKDEVKLIEAAWDGFVRIWNFHTGKILKKISVQYDFLNSICLWKNDLLFVGCSDKKIKLIDLNKGTIIKEAVGHNNNVVTIKRIIHPKFGECLISQAALNEPIKLWTFKI